MYLIWGKKKNCMQSEKILNLIKTAEQNDWLIGLFGWGIWGKNYGFRILEWLGLRPDFVSDSNVDKICNLQEMGVKVIHKTELLKINQEMLIFVCIGQYYLKEVIGQLETNRNIRIITLDDVLNLDNVLEKFYGVMNIRSYEKKKSNLICVGSDNYKKKYKMGNRIAVYTCITGGYDKILEPLVKEDICDYYLISDNCPDNLQVFSWINIYEYLPDNIKGFPEMNRYCKMHGESIFCDYKYSIYIDGNTLLTGGISNHIKEIGKIGVGLHKHGFEDCIYTEGMRMVGNGTCNYNGVRRQMIKYLHEGMPRNYGMFECFMIVRDHSNNLGSTVMHEWFVEYMNGEKRDQFSLTYVLWKHGLPFDSIGAINNGKSWRDNANIRIEKKHLK